jgi:hypothetical protein
MAETVKEGQVIGRSSGSFRHWLRTGCGSTPETCGHSHQEDGILPGRLTYCDLVAKVANKIEIVDEASGKKGKEVVTEIYCGAIRQ